MKEAQIEALLEKIFLEVLRLNEFEDTRLISRQDFEAWDSFAHLELLIRIEEQFGIDLAALSSSTYSNFFEIRDAIMGQTRQNHE
jgi:acyl carrier protein